MNLRLPFLILCFIPGFFSLCYSQSAPPWWQQTVIYQIYPRSFQDSDGDGIGDLNGIISRLDYLEDLGVETIWLSPFYESPQRDFGYDIMNYRDIAPEYGDLETADSLITEIHRRGMRVVFDLVLNHTSDQHPWFLESKSSRDNPKADWYVWKDGRGKRPPNNWVNVINQKAWNYSPEREQWYYTAFLPFQPDLNWRNPEVREEMYNIARFWLKRGVDGFRLDIFNCILEDADFRNNPRRLNPLPSTDGMRSKMQWKLHNINHPDNYGVAQELRSVIDEFGEPDRFLVGEVFGPMENLTGFVKGKKPGLNLVFLFEMLRIKFNAKYYREMLTEFNDSFPTPYIPTLVYGNHDNFRMISGVKNDMEKAKVLAMVQLLARGVPVIYYGEEAGMMNGEIKKKDALDPISETFSGIPQFLRNWLPIPLNRDVCRTPMQWDKEKNAGFSTGDSTWLPMGPAWKTRNIEVHQQDTFSLLNTYKRLLVARKAPPLNTRNSSDLPGFEFLGGKWIPKNVLAFRKRSQLIFINFSQKQQTFDLPEHIHPGPHEGRIKLQFRLTPQDSLNDERVIKLGPYGGVLTGQYGPGEF